MQTSGSALARLWPCIAAAAMEQSTFVEREFKNRSTSATKVAPTPCPSRSSSCTSSCTTWPAVSSPYETTTSCIAAPAAYIVSHVTRPLRQLACSFDWWLMVGADLFWEKSTAGWLLVAGLFWEKSTAGWWLINQTNRRHQLASTNLPVAVRRSRPHISSVSTRTWPS
jgi:hypothetical protein